jgi:hypothetical protein
MEVGIMTFNPSDHLMKVQDKDYLEVKWRLVWFREKFPNGSIETEMLVLDLDRETEEEVTKWVDNPERPGKKMPTKEMKRANGFAVFRAIVKDGQGGVGTGTKSEKAASFPDFIEKAESGSIGRALAALGFGTQFTGDELAEHHRIVDSPISFNGHVQSDALAELIGKAKIRAKTLNLAHNKPEWEAFLQECTGEVLTDKDLTLALIARVNGTLTQIERERTVAAK